MTKESEKEVLITRYLYGELNEEEQDRVEQQFLTDNQFFEQMLSVEDGLIDDYVRSQLSDHERKKVEELLQSSNREKREIDSVNNLIGVLRKARSMDTVRVEIPSRRRSLFTLPSVRGSGKQFSFALLLFLVIFCLGLAVWNIALQNKLLDIQARHAELQKETEELRQRADSQGDDSDRLGRRIEDAHRKSDQIEQEVNALKESRATTTANDTFTLALTMQSFTRSGDRAAFKEIRLGQGTNWIKIIIDTGEADFESFGVTIETFGGDELWSREDLKPARAKSGRIEIVLTARLFSKEDYNLMLKGRRADGSTVNIGDYSFRVKE